ncbi:MAG: hypothetical protein ACRDYA_05290 [Egibacteraceae bacterium]
MREHEPCALHANALCAHFDVGSAGELGLGYSREAGRNWTWTTKAERKAEVERRKLLQDGGKAFVADRYVTAPNGEVVAHMRTLTDRLAHVSLTPQVRPRLAAVACDAASLAGSTALHAGRRAEADRWFADALALAVAREAEDRRLETLDRHLPVADQAYVNSDLSRELAAVGDDLGSGHALERALDAARLIGCGEPGWWSEHAQLSGWDGARLTVFTGVRSRFLGRHRDALPEVGERLALV